MSAHTHEPNVGDLSLGVPHDVAVVTGAASGIGRRIATRFRERGWSVVAVDRDVEGLDRLVADHHRFIPVVGDVAVRTTHEQAADVVPDDAALRAWVNCAGIAEQASAHLADADHLDRMLAVNLGGVFWGCAVAVEALAEGGAITNISSTQAVLGFAGYPAYAASKGGILGLTTQVAAEYGPRGVRCNAVLPGVIHTTMNDRILADAQDPDALRAAWDRLCPVGRWGEPDDVAELVMFLSSPQAGFLTGAHIRLDGGQTAVPPTWEG